VTPHDIWLVALPAFAASLVECVEALTIVLAVAAVAGLRPALGGAAAALVLLVAVIALFGPRLTAIPEQPFKLVVGGLLLLFGLRWLRKAILRAAGALALRDEARAYARQREQFAGRNASERWNAFGTSFGGVALEGVEVAFIVLAFGRTAATFNAAALGAGVAAVAIGGVGIALHRPLQRVPENALKLIVGIMLSGIGTFWFTEGLGVRWPGDVAIVIPIAAYALASAGLILWIGRRRGSERGG
jgi:uncharacterized membrane protein